MKTTIRCWSLGMRGSWLILSALVVVPALVLAPSIPAAAQDTPKPQEPDYVNSFFLLDSGTTLKPLEREPVGIGSKHSPFGLGGSGVSYEIQNDHSPIRIPAGAPIEIIVKLEKPDVDPATIVLLYPLKVVKEKRQLLISGASFMALHSKSDLQSKQLQMTFTKYGQSSVKITPASPLAPGEYAIAVQSQNQQLTAYCFGIDAAK